MRPLLARDIGPVSRSKVVAVSEARNPESVDFRSRSLVPTGCRRRRRACGSCGRRRVRLEETIDENLRRVRSGLRALGSRGSETGGGTPYDMCRRCRKNACTEHRRERPRDKAMRGIAEKHFAVLTWNFLAQRNLLELKQSWYKRRN